jgi:hypothetical protein
MLNGLFVKVAYVADVGNCYAVPKYVKVDHRRQHRVTMLSAIASGFERGDKRKVGKLSKIH